MNWQSFRQLKGQSVQEYTQEFRRRALLLGVDLQSQVTFLKYIGGLHNYLIYTILMFNPTSLDEVCVQATHLEARGKNTFNVNEGSDLKGKGRKRIANSRKEKGKLFCKKCSKTDQNEYHCWKIHLELKPEKYKNKDKTKEKRKIVATIE